MVWKPLTTPLYPWVRTLEHTLTSGPLPLMSGPAIYIASDYGGTHKQSLYRVNVLLYADLEGSADWEALRTMVRQRYLADGRRMSYKGLGDRQRAKALVPFLSAAEEIHGVCLAMIYNKKIRHLSLNAGDYEKMRQIAPLHARWKNRELEEALRITHLVGCLAGGLSQPSQHIYWISDEDSLFANVDRQQDVARLASLFTSHYAKHELVGELGVGTTVIDEGDRFEEDLTAISDLVAGAISETTSRLAELCGSHIPSNLAVEYPREFIPKADLIARWFWSAQGRLRRLAVLFECQPEGVISVQKHEMLTSY